MMPWAPNAAPSGVRWAGFSFPTAHHGNAGGACVTGTQEPVGNALLIDFLNTCGACAAALFQILTVATAHVSVVINRRDCGFSLSSLPPSLHVLSISFYKACWPPMPTAGLVVRGRRACGPRICWGSERGCGSRGPVLCMRERAVTTPTWGGTSNSTRHRIVRVPDAPGRPEEQLLKQTCPLPGGGTKRPTCVRSNRSNSAAKAC